MSFQMLLAGGASVPPTLPREPKPHVCGKCRSPYGGRPDCPNNNKGQTR